MEAFALASRRELLTWAQEPVALEGDGFRAPPKRMIGLLKGSFRRVWG